MAILILIELNAPNEISIEDSQILATGDFGQIFIGNLIQPSQVKLEGQRTITEDGFDFSNIISTTSSNADDLAGRIIINARDSINVIGSNIDSGTQATRTDINDRDRLNFSTIELKVAEENPIGTITIDKSEVSASNFKTGFAGNINLDAPNEISIEDSQILAEGNFGQIFIGNLIQPSQVLLKGTRTEDDSGSSFSNRISTSSSNTDDLAGNIIINARDNINVIGSEIESRTETTRTTDINDREGFNFSTISLKVAEENPIGTITLDRSRISTTNFNTGFAGDVTLNARDNIQVLDTSIFSRGEEGRILIGKSNLSNETTSPQEINFNNSSLQISNESVENSPETQIDGGEISIDAINNISFVNSSEISTVTERLGNAGNLTISSENGSVFFDRSNVFSNVEVGGIGNGGSIEINTANITFTNQAGLTTSSAGQGDAGNITVNATNNFIADNSLITSNIGSNAEDPAVGKVGNIFINARDIALSGTAQIQAGAFGGATAEAPGTVSLTATESISFTGNTGIFSNNDPGSFGDASNTQLIAPTVILSDGAFVTASNAADGQGGNVTVESDRLLLDNSKIEADAEGNVGEGANINLQVADDITLQNDSSISAQAFNNADGGNININTNFIVAFPDGNNDISASAEQGLGGDITITAESIFGIEERPLKDSTNDIDASSARGAQFDGNVAITTPEVDAIRGATELPTNVVEVQQTAADVCAASPDTGKPTGLTVKGKGGIIPPPDSPLSADVLNIGGKISAERSPSVHGSKSRSPSVPLNKGEVNAVSSQINSEPAKIEPIQTDNGPIYPAMGILKTKDGRVILTAYPIDDNDNNTVRTPVKKANCN